MSANRKIFLIAALFLMPFFVSGDVLGQNTQFFIDTKYDESGRSSISATLRQISERAYFYVEDSFYNRISQTAKDNLPNWISNLALEFDNKIYPKEIDFWGREPNPGIDNDPRIFVILTPLIGTAGGYYDSSNQRPGSEEPISNQREMVYLNADIVNNTKRISSFLAHEFQHLISFNQKELLRNVNDDVWINELRSEYISTLLGYNDNFEDSNLQRRVKAFLDFPSDSLTEWKNETGDYGSVAMFGEYLAEHYGASIIVDSLRSGKIGIESINDALSRNNYNTSFEEIFRNWTIANILNDITIDNHYGYFKAPLRQNIRVQPTKMITALDDLTVFVHSGQIKDWQPQWFWVSGFSSGSKPVLEISFTGEDIESMKAILIAFTGDGRKSFQLADLSKGDKIYLDKIFDIEKVIFIPYKGRKIAGFGKNEPLSGFSFSLQRLNGLPAVPAPTLPPIEMKPQGGQDQVQPSVNIGTGRPSPEVAATPSGKRSQGETPFPNGSLLRATRSDIKVYIVNNGWKRHIVSPAIFGFYGHLGLGFDKVIEVEPSVIASYPESRVLRFAGSKRVYELDRSNNKHWLNMGAGQFTASGRKWEAIFIINEKEFNFYKTGYNITR